MFSDLLSSFFVYADAKQGDSGEDEKEKVNNESSGKQEEKEAPEESSEDTSEEEAPAEESAGEEEEEDEPEDIHPSIREECSSSAKCAPLKKHFDHCQEKVEGGHGFKHEDCVEEMFHLMHCADSCAAPKLFSKLQ